MNENEARTLIERLKKNSRAGVLPAPAAGR